MSGPVTALLAAPAEPPPWMAEAQLWLAAAAVVLLAACAAGLWTLVARFRKLADYGRRLDAVEDLRDQVARLVGGTEALDLRRIEHVLVDLRDGQHRLEDALLRAVERAPRDSGRGVDAALPAALGERVVNRLLSLGYERVQLVTGSAELDGLERADGEVLVEAHRQGALCKGRVLVRGGRISEVQVKPTYSAFP